MPSADIKFMMLDQVDTYNRYDEDVSKTRLILNSEIGECYERKIMFRLLQQKLLAVQKWRTELVTPCCSL